MFIKNNIRVDQYANTTTCPVTVIGSDADTTLDADIQIKLAGCYHEADCQIFKGITHENYFVTDEVLKFVQENVLEKR